MYTKHVILHVGCVRNLRDAERELTSVFQELDAAIVAKFVSSNDIKSGFSSAEYIESVEKERSQHDVNKTHPRNSYYLSDGSLHGRLQHMTENREYRTSLRRSDNSYPRSEASQSVETRSENVCPETPTRNNQEYSNDHSRAKHQPDESDEVIEQTAINGRKRTKTGLDAHLGTKLFANAGLIEEQENEGSVSFPPDCERLVHPDFGRPDFNSDKRCSIMHMDVTYDKDMLLAWALFTSIRHLKMITSVIKQQEPILYALSETLVCNEEESQLQFLLDKLAKAKDIYGSSLRTANRDKGKDVSMESSSDFPVKFARVRGTQYESQTRSWLEEKTSWLKYYVRSVIGRKEIVLSESFHNLKGFLETLDQVHLLTSEIVAHMTKGFPFLSELSELILTTDEKQMLSELHQELGRVNEDDYETSDVSEEWHTGDNVSLLLDKQFNSSHRKVFFCNIGELVKLPSRHFRRKTIDFDWHHVSKDDHTDCSYKHSLAKYLDGKSDRADSRKEEDGEKKCCMIAQRHEKHLNGRIMNLSQSAESDTECSLGPNTVANCSSMRAFSDDRTQDRNIPLRVEMHDEGSRLRSFDLTPVANSARGLAAAGFYATGEGDATKCFSCGIVCTHWREDDNPFIMHIQRSPHCRHVMGTESRNVPVDFSTLCGTDSHDGCEREENGNEQTSHETTYFDTHDGNSDHVAVNALSEEVSAMDMKSNSFANLTSKYNVFLGPAEQRTSQKLPVKPWRQSIETSPTLLTGQSGSVSKRNLDLSCNAISTQTFDSADQPHYRDASTRLHSFQHCLPRHCKEPLELALAGFYYAGYADCVRCFACGTGLRTWEPSDDPWVEHVRWRPSCAYVNAVRGPDQGSHRTSNEETNHR